MTNRRNFLLSIAAVPMIPYVPRETFSATSWVTTYRNEAALANIMDGIQVGRNMGTLNPYRDYMIGDYVMDHRTRHVTHRVAGWAMDDNKSPIEYELMLKPVSDKDGVFAGKKYVYLQYYPPTYPWDFEQKMSNETGLTNRR